MVLDMKKLTPQEKEFFKVLKECNRTPYQQAKNAMVGSLAVDHQLVAAVGYFRYQEHRCLELLEETHEMEQVNPRMLQLAEGVQCGQ